MKETGSEKKESDDSTGQCQASSDTDLAPEFTAQFNAYAAKYYSPQKTFLRWCRVFGLFGPRDRKRPVWERTVASFGYLVPMAIQVRLMQQLFCSSEAAALGARFLDMIARITGPMVQPLAMVTASTWLLCGALDERAMPSSFVRGHLRQALLMTMLASALMLQAGFAPIADVYSQALSPTLHGLRSGILGAINLLWLVCVAFCLTGRKIARRPVASSVAPQSVER